MIIAVGVLVLALALSAAAVLRQSFLPAVAALVLTLMYLDTLRRRYRNGVSEEEREADEVWGVPLAFVLIAVVIGGALLWLGII